MKGMSGFTGGVGGVVADSDAEGGAKAGLMGTGVLGGGGVESAAASEP